MNDKKGVAVFKKFYKIVKGYYFIKEGIEVKK